ncbi:solute carrier family 2, facilitated glucose transporter member 1 [Ixodes scapularis]|uniref:solute carrier family 2, facilitated glucose transporter member 1 n=1 Tax=Ixodes scapularis TaxID=6945 RepID=UPI001A9F0952|nr:solute carrier family 2, facilitated glucose transporter member 1 [Ixodes scapularis]
MPYQQKKQGLTLTLVLAVLSSAVGSAFHHGYHLGVVNSPQQVLEDFINSTFTERFGEPASEATVTLVFSVFVAVFCVGGMMGGLLTACVADRFGRRGGLLLNSGLVFAAALLMTLSRGAASYELLVLGRLIAGINAGLTAGLAPLYLCEISPIRYRGATGTIYQLVLTVSILFAQLVGIPQLLGNDDNWPYLFALAVIPSVLMLMSLPFCPESPKYLLMVRCQPKQAEAALIRLRGTRDVLFEMDVMKSEAEAAEFVPKVTLQEMLRNLALRAPLIISLMVMLAQQLSGINAAIFFSTDIFMTAGLDAEGAMQATLGMGVVNVLMTLVSMVVVERAGRRTLLLAGMAGMALSTVVLTVTLAFKDHAVWVSYVSIGGLLAFVITFAIGPGSIPWFLVTELFGQGARPIASSLAVGVNWAANFVVGIAFLPLMEVVQHYTFLIFTLVLVFFWVFIYKKLPETKNKSIEEITNMFRVRAYKDDTPMTKLNANSKA